MRVADEEYKDVTVLLGARDANRGKSAVDTLLQSTSLSENRIRLVVLDMNSPDSIRAAAATVGNGSLYWIINNARIGHGNAKDVTLATNYYGVKSVTETFLLKLQPKNGHIVMISSASGPYFLIDLKKQRNDTLFTKLGQPWTIGNGVKELDEIADTYDVKEQGKKSWDSYGLSKALLNAYTYILSRQHPDLIINAITPGFIETDLTACFGRDEIPGRGCSPGRIRSV